jgi:hypothetical protein
MQIMKIYIKGIYTPIGDVQIKVYHSDREAVNYRGNKISFSENSGNIFAIKELKISESEFNYIRDTEKKLPRDEQFEEHLTSQYRDVQTILKYIQAFDSVFNLDGDLRMQCCYEWSEDQLAWMPVPDKRRTGWRGIGLQVTLPDGFLTQIERLSNSGIPVFSAFKHLYKAYEETNPRFKWINGTIAAEHAFKEFLSIIDPRAESLMLNIPSPPIEKLYKNVLFAYTNQESSVYKQLQKGAVKRNELIHRPTTVSPDLKETNIYLHQVEVAIFELYALLYPKDNFFEVTLSAAKQRLKHVEEGGAYY